MLVDFIIVVIKAAMVMGALLGLAAINTWFERKCSALIQDRIGANRASFFGFDLAGLINTLVADPVKAIMKEDFVPKGTSQFMHCLGVFLSVFPVLVSFAVIPLGPSFILPEFNFPNPLGTDVLVASREVSLQLANLNVGVLYVFAMGSLAVYGLVIAGWVSNNKFSLFGGLRASAQMISYEITMGLSIIGLIACYQTLDLQEIVIAQGGSVFNWGLLRNPFNFIAFLIFFTSMMAETKRAPFDLPESESELVAGYLTEYSGMKFLLFWLGEFAEIVIAATLVVVLFCGGWQLPGVDLASMTWGPLIGMAVLGAKVTFFCLLQIVIRWTLPRFRYDQLMNLCWKIMLPISLANLVATAIFLLMVGS